MSSLDEYIEQHTTPEPELFAQITRDTNLHILNPHMLSGQVQGELLRMLSRMIRPQHILELGTFTGYSALCLAEGLAEGGELITIEHNDELEATIRRNLSQSPLGKQIQLIIGDAKQIISDLSSVSASGLSAPAVCQAKPVSLLSGEAGQKKHRLKKKISHIFANVGFFLYLCGGLQKHTDYESHLFYCPHYRNPSFGGSCHAVRFG